MLVIRQEQMDTLIKGTDEEFVDFLVEHVKEQEPELEEEYDDESLREWVRVGLKRAESHGFQTAADLTAFVSLMFRIAPNFDEQPDIKAVFDDRGIPREQCFERLESPAFPKKAWLEAEENYDENAWILESEENAEG